MRIILDSNILFSALIRDSLTRRLILQYKDFFLFPSLIFDEMAKHRGLLLKKSGLNHEEFIQLLNLLLCKVIVVPKKVLEVHKREAWKIVKNIDPDDVLLIACALAYSSSVIWSEDKKLKQQSKVRVFSTEEIKGLL